MKRIFLYLGLLLAGCTPLSSPQDGLAQANAEFKGHDSGEFFADYGSAQSAKKLGNGDKLYRWVSVEPLSGGEEGGYITYPSGNYVMPGNLSNGEMITGYCQVSILTDADERIKKITLLADSIGKFSGSRCGEIFSLSNATAKH